MAIELAHRGFSVVGIDSDAAMLHTARTKAPELDWVHADLVEMDSHVGAEFDLVVAAGNVMIFLAPGSERSVVDQLATRLAPDGLLVSGFQLNTGRLTLERYDEYAAAAGLELVHRWSTWDSEPFFGTTTPSPYIEAISRLTRSSTERNGSLHSTVRWAWSLSLR